MHSESFDWVVHTGAILIVRWVETNNDVKEFPFVFLDSAKLKLADGSTVRVIKGKIQ
jgi:hypothetical protein